MLKIHLPICGFFVSFTKKRFFFLQNGLQSLLCALRESHKVRLMFRRAGGYLCLMSLLINLEGKLGASGVTAETNQEAVMAEVAVLLSFMEIVFKVLAISMRYEPSNAKYFSQEVILFFF